MKSKISGFGKRLRDRRLALGLSPHDLAQAVRAKGGRRCSRTHIFNWENDVMTPRIDSLEPLCAALGCLMGELLGERPSEV